MKTRTLNPAAAPFVPGRWASKKAALVFPAEMVSHLSTLSRLLSLLHCRLYGD